MDVDFVRKSIKAIGQTAVKIDEAAERCVNVLLDLIATRVSYVVQEAVVVMKVNALSLSQTMHILMKFRTSFANIPQPMKVSFQHCALTSMSSTNQKQRLP